MADANFGPLLAFTDVEDAVLAHYRHWLEIWLAARERKLGLSFNTIARPRSYLVKQTFTALPGEERTPIVIAVSDGLSEAPGRSGDGHYTVEFRFGIMGICLGVDGVRARALAGHYQAALLGIALKHQKVDIGDSFYAKMCDFRDIRIEDVDDEALGRSMSAVRLEMSYRITNFAEDIDPPSDTPPTGPTPQPDDPTVQTVHIDVVKQGG